MKASQSQFQEIESAVQTLSRTERGREVMRQVLGMLDDAGVGLDLEGQAAVFTLLQATWGQYTGSARDAMREALGPQE